jgi:hypothetical protein
MSISASGFVPGSGAGGFSIRRFETALARSSYLCRSARRKCKFRRTTWSRQHDGAKSVAVQRCIKSALENAGIEADAIDTMWTSNFKKTVWNKKLGEALGEERVDFHKLFKINGRHCLSLAGSIESVASILQLSGFIFQL